MKKIFVLLMLLLFTGFSFAADLPLKKHKNVPQGTFKQNRNGDFVQYDTKGKKIGVYRMENGKLIKIK